MKVFDNPILKYTVILPVKQFKFFIPLPIKKIFTNFAEKKNSRFQAWLRIIFQLTETNNVDKTCKSSGGRRRRIGVSVRNLSGHSGACDQHPAEWVRRPKSLKRGQSQKKRGWELSLQWVCQRVLSERPPSLRGGEGDSTMKYEVRREWEKQRRNRWTHQDRGFQEAGLIYNVNYGSSKVLCNTCWQWAGSAVPGVTGGFCQRSFSKEVGTEASCISRSKGTGSPKCLGPQAFGSTKMPKSWKSKLIFN